MLECASRGSDNGARRAGCIDRANCHHGSRRRLNRADCDYRGRRCLNRADRYDRRGGGEANHSSGPGRSSSSRRHYYCRLGGLDGADGRVDAAGTMG
jgi:hypothetical protein